MDHLLGGPLTLEQLWNQLSVNELTLNIVGVPLIELPENIVGGKADGLQQNGCRKLSPPVDPDMEYILWIKLKIKP